MRVLMLGWEYPPHIAGGLGTACEGLTKAMALRGVTIDFVLPHKFGDESAPHMVLLDPESLAEAANVDDPNHLTAVNGLYPRQQDQEIETQKARTTTQEPNALIYGNAYARPSTHVEKTRETSETHTRSHLTWSSDKARVPQEIVHLPPQEAMQGILQESLSDLDNAFFQAVHRFTNQIETISRDHHDYFHATFDVVHAHDWMTYPAGIIAARTTGVPLVAHVHSLEFDRAGEGGNPVIHAIEAVGIRAADQVIAVSQYTKDQIVKKLGVPAERISVAHNGVKPAPPVEYAMFDPLENTPRVLFLGRVTFQKGPEFFIEAARLVARKVPKAKFVMAGSGDMLDWAKQRVKDLGLEKKFEFPGFVKGESLEKEFRHAWVFVMPSVSEPFGIVALEAIHRGTPTIVSKQSGVSEVMKHLFKVDFWDTHKIADLIINILLHPELARSMRTLAKKEVTGLGWDSTAERVGKVYLTLAPELASSPI